MLLQKRITNINNPKFLIYCSLCIVKVKLKFYLFCFRLKQNLFLQLSPFSSELELQHRMLDLRFLAERWVLLFSD